MKYHNKVNTTTIMCALGLSLLSPVVFADTSMSKGVLNQEQTLLDVTVPLSIPISVDRGGAVTTATNLIISNNSIGKIEVSNIAITPKDKWALSEFNKDYSSSRLGLKELGLKIDNKDVATTGVIPLVGKTINGGDSSILSYDASISPQKEAILNATIADVVLTIGWVEAIETPSIPGIETDNGNWVDSVSTDKYKLATDLDFTQITYDSTKYFVYQGSDDYVIVPQEIKGKTIKDASFMFSSGLINSNKLKPINVKGVIFQDGIEILDNTFMSDGSIKGASTIESIGYLPNSVFSMWKTFESCYSLKETPMISNGVKTMDSTFVNCEGLVEPPEIPNSVISMEGTFKNCINLLSTPILPEGVKDMWETFAGCSSLLTVANIPVDALKMDATFKGCSSLVTAPKLPDGVTDAWETFANCVNLVDVPNIPGSIELLEGTFKGCSSLVTAPTISEGVERMEDTYAYCTSLVNIPDIPNSVKNMDGAFRGCSNLVTAPRLSENVESVWETFAYCSNLVNVSKIPNSVVTLEGTFKYCKKLVNAPILSTSITDMWEAFKGCESLKNAPLIPNSVLSMDNTFEGCVALMGDVTIPKDVRSIYKLFEGTTKPITMKYYRGSAIINTDGWKNLPGNVSKIML